MAVTTMRPMSTNRALLRAQLHVSYNKLALDPAFSHLRRSSFVPGEGGVPSRVMLIGEAPGAQEDLERRPFVGPSGQLLEHMLGGIGSCRAMCFITNVIKWRPPNDRVPTPAEVSAAYPYLQEELAAVDPRLIVLAGATALRAFFPGASMRTLHGRPIPLGGRIFLGVHHPSAALSDLAVRELLVGDFKMVKRLAGVPRDLEHA